MTKKRQVLVEKEREVTTYADIWYTSLCLLKKGQREPKGSYHQIMASLVFTAFTFEAYLNHIGKKLLSCWNDLERLSPREKLNVISERLGIPVDYGIRPWHVMKELFQFRNDVAHGKSIPVRTKEVLSLEKAEEDDRPGLIKSRWEKYCTLRNAIRAREDVDKMVHLIHAAAGFKDDFPFVSGFQLGSSRVIDE